MYIGFTFVDGMKKPHTCSVIVGVGEVATFDVTYTPQTASRSLGSIQLSVEDNQYEDSVVQVNKLWMYVRIVFSYLY